jgi:hypothetical protein
MKNKKINLRRKIILVEGVLVLGILIYLFFSMAPKQVYPLNGMTIIDPDFNFEIENGEGVIISSDRDFSNVIILTRGADVVLGPGNYYWKVKGRFRESEIMNFTVQGNVGLSIKKKKGSYEIENSGNVELNITERKSGFTGEIILDVGESEKIRDGNSSYEGRQR